jgi:hypothetical protein
MSAKCRISGLWNQAQEFAFHYVNRYNIGTWPGVRGWRDRPGPKIEKHRQ